MYCPECGAEYRPGFAECGDCGVALVASLPPDDRPDPDSKTVEVYSTTDTMMLPILTSILESAEIEFFVQGEEALGLLPVGAMGSAVSRASLAARIHVFERDAETARQLLTEVDTDFAAAELDEAEDAGEPTDD